MIKAPKKLIEVALPLDDINEAAAREKSIRHGHPSTLHLWWARRPLAAVRAVLFAQMVNDPGGERGWQRYPGQTKEDAQHERERLFAILRDLVQWENTTNEAVLNKARAEIRKSWRETCAMNPGEPGFDPERLPAFHDPFAGGGSIPLEAQRLGLEAYASDLNPVAVLINKAMIEIPPKFAGRPPVNPEAQADMLQKQGLGPRTPAGKGETLPGPHGAVTRDAASPGEPASRASATIIAAGLGGDERNEGSAESATPQPGVRGGALKEYRGAQGLAEDVRYYGQWMRDEAFKRIGHLYPPVKAVQNPDGTWRHATPEECRGASDECRPTPSTPDPSPSVLSPSTPDPSPSVLSPSTPDPRPSSARVTELTAIAWIWARTVHSPNPAFRHVEVPLVKSFVLSSKKGHEAWLNPVVDGDTYRLDVCHGSIPPGAEEGTQMARGAKFRCVLSGSPIGPDYIKTEAVAGRMAQRLIAIVCENPAGQGRIYLPACAEHERIAKSARPAWKPSQKVPTPCHDVDRLPMYGMPTWGDAFSARQLAAMTTFSDLVSQARDQAAADAKSAGWADDGVPLHADGNGAQAYGAALSVYLAMGVDKSADYWTSLASWQPDAKNQRVGHVFSRQAIPMAWDYGESYPFGQTTGNFVDTADWIARVLEKLPACGPARAFQASATDAHAQPWPVVSTDPPYYDNVGYADLSDFFYVWLRPVLRSIFSDLFATVVVPKAEELIASPYRHDGGKAAAESFFLDGMTKALHNLAESAHPAFPVTIYYAFKQDAGVASTGWETFLEAVVRSGFAVTGTWPMRTELGNRMISMGTNALASSIILVCRRRDPAAPSVSRRDFQRELREALPPALETMVTGGDGRSPIAPVDLAQAAIGPGMAVFSKYTAVLEADGSRLGVHEALIQINREIDDYFNAVEGELDADSRFCIDWFQQYGFGTGAFGEADVLARAKGTSVDHVAAAGVVESGGGKVRLLTFADYPADWSPEKDRNIPTWEALHQLVRALETGGEAAAGALLARLPERADGVRQLAYRLYTLCERDGRAEEARAYNSLICSWRGTVQASETASTKGKQMEFKL